VPVSGKSFLSARTQHKYCNKTSSLTRAVQCDVLNHTRREVRCYLEKRRPKRCRSCERCLARDREVDVASAHHGYCIDVLTQTDTDRHTDRQTDREVDVASAHQGYCIDVLTQTDTDRQRDRETG